MSAQPTLYEQIGGFDKLLQVTKRWHVLCLTTRDTAHPFEHPMHPQHDERLAAYLAEAFGGPWLYTGGYGDESFVQRLHAGNGVHVQLDEDCIRFFEQSLADCCVASGPAARAAAYFRRATEEMRFYDQSKDQVPGAVPFNYATE